MNMTTDFPFVAVPMDLLFEPETEPAVGILDVTIKEEPVQNEDCDIFNNEFINIIKFESSGESPLEDLDPNNINEDTQEYVLHKQRDGVIRHRLLECLICKKKYIKRNLKEHMKTHERKKEVKVQLPLKETCKSFGNSNNDNDNAGASTEYVLYKCGDRVKKHPLVNCPVCNKQFIKVYMKHHMRTHAEIAEDKQQTKQVECEVCKTILSAPALSAHMRIHSGDKPFVCPTCGWLSGTAQRLREHETTHSDARPFLCAHCFKGFKTQKYLKQHVRIHAGENPFSCLFCGKKFAAGASLRMHMKTHANDNPYICSVCNKTCISKGTLAIHMVKHTKAKKYECTACGFKFGREDYLHNHVMRWCKGDPKKIQSNGDELNA